MIKCLIVDDNRANLYMLETMLKGYGLEVTSAENGKDALDNARLNPPDLIVTDILMPVMDGYALCRQWKSDDKLKTIPLVFYTATYTGPEDEKFALSLGADLFIIKPQEPDIFMDKLKKVLGEKYTARQVVNKPLGEEMEFFRQHNETLFRKLEKKMSELETSNKKLGALEETYRLSFENVSDVIYTIDANLNILSVSPSVEKIMGYKPQDFIGRSVSDIANILTPESFKQALADINLVLKGETISSVIYEFVARDKTIKIGEVSGDPIMRDGKVAGLISVARDITGRKKAEDALKQADENFRNFLDDSVMGVRIVSADGKTICANQAILDLFGFDSMEELKETPVTKCYTAESQAENRLRRERRKRGENGPLNYVISIVRKNGEIRHLEVLRKEIIWDGAKCFQVLYHDITERKRMEEELQKEKYFNQTLIQHSPAFFVAINSKGETVMMNDALLSALGYTKEEIEGKNYMATFVPEIDKDGLSKVFEQLIQIKKPTVNVNHILAKDGRQLLVEWYGQPVFKESGEIDYFFGVGLNVTERKQAEDALRESEMKYRGILESLDDAYFELDLKGNLVFFNETFMQKTGYSREELMGMNYRHFVSSEFWEHALKTYSKIFTTGKPDRNFYYEIIMKNGQKRYFESWSDLLIDKNKQPIGFRGMARDITERKRGEEKLQQTLESLRNAVGTTIQVMVSAVEMRDPYTAGHQIRTADLARAIAMEMGLPQEKIDGIRMIGSIHDIGKLSIPSEILSKPTKLTDLEFSLIKEHPKSGYEMLKDVESPWPLAETVYQHHERINGSGYPRNLKGDEILIEARILAVADVVEAMASHRPYRASLGIEAALEEIEKNKGILYDDAVADACLRLFREKSYQLK